MRSTIYKLALLAVIVCVFVILVAPDIDLPDSTVLRVKDGFHLVATTIDLSAGLLVAIVVAFAVFVERAPVSTRFRAPTTSSLCTFLC